MHFLEITKQQVFYETVKYEATYGIFFFSKLKLFLSLKNAWLPPIFFLDTKSTC